MPWPPARLLKRLCLTERETMRALGAWHIAIADWGLKAALPRHWWHDSLHADALRSRVLELRYPRRDVDSDHDPGSVLGTRYSVLGTRYSVLVKQLKNR